MIELATIGTILFTLLLWYFIVARYFCDKPILAFSMYLFLMICLPNNIGFHYKIDHRLWQFLAIIFLIPHAFDLFSHGKIRFDVMDIAIIMLIFLGSITTFIGLGKQSGIGSIYKGFLYIFLPYLGGRYFIKNEEDFFKIMKVMTWCAIIVSLIALVEFYTDRGYLERMPFLMDPEGWGGSHMYYRFGQKRVMASFGHPIYLGLFVLLVALINVVLLLQKVPNDNIIKRRYLFIQLLFASIVVLISQTRTGVVSFIIVILIFFITRAHKIKLGATLGYLLMTSIISFPLFIYYFHEYIQDFIYYNITSECATDNLAGRMLAISEGIKGLNTQMNWFGESNRYFFTARWTLENTELSNGFIDPITTRGIFYSILYLFLWLLSFCSLYKKNRQSVEIILLFSLIYLFIANNITGLAFQITILFYIIIGFSFNKFIFDQKREL